jgi:hypothetical protein
MSYKQKYLKYKSKYLELKGGVGNMSWSDKQHFLDEVTHKSYALGYLQYKKKNLKLKNSMVGGSLKLFTEYQSTLPRPFVELYDDKDNKINCVLVSHPFTRQKGENGTFEQYEQWKKEGVHFVGITSFSEFPGHFTNPYDGMKDRNSDCWKLHDYMKYFDIWLNCFRNPEKYIDKDKKLALISESDFIDINRFNEDKNIKKEYDFIYICNDDDPSDNCSKGWNYYIRNWELAKKCITIMCGKYKMKGVIIGRKDCELPTGCENLVEKKEFIPRDELINLYRKTKFILLPNTIDASPRILTEALSCGCCCLVNYNILGGWKYVNEKTGEYFTNEVDFEKSLLKLTKNYSSYNPSKYFSDNYGKYHSGKKLKEFLCKYIPELNSIQTEYFYIKI